MVKEIIRRILLLLIFSCFFFVFAFDSSAASFVRVAVFKDASKLTLDVDASFRITTVEDDLELLKLDKASGLLIETIDKGFNIGSNNIGKERIEITRDDDGFISINDRLFRGRLRFIKKDASNFFVVNYIELEDYIRGVLYHEISHLWPEESIKAQAVVVRTFALSKMHDNRLKEYDLTNDTYSQVYGGRTSERWRTNKGVDATGGEVLKLDGKIFPTYYHAACGGHTEDVSNLWDVDIASLKGVTCPYCADSPHFKWDIYIDFKRLQEKLNAAGLRVGKIESIEIVERSLSNRVLKLKIISATDTIEISGKALREILGPKILRSTNFQIESSGDFVLFKGFGWGHGVGLCQWGAYFMGKQGHDYRQILEYYYHGAKIEKDY
ncbi:MAG: SpoIID/LytB domain-containing protein [Candidatus Omnitrophica bacterium]|nr:SpoIID/LytB domain-containing protein [Candidatus Omnitrophota bacterium]